MKRLTFILPAALAGGLWLAGLAQAQTLGEKKFEARGEAEAALDLTASVPGASWMEAGREAATVKILVDGRHHQDLILFNAARRFTYRVLLGRVAPGAHAVRVELNAARSAAGASRVELHELAVALVEPSQPEYLALAHAPILYARPNTIGKFSDVPLLMYYEIERQGERTRLRYSVIFSNEDGGTQTAALMARWGRTTDIEWVIETEIDAQGRAGNATYQGVNHETKSFRGRREADQFARRRQFKNSAAIRADEQSPADSTQSRHPVLRQFGVGIFEDADDSPGVDLRQSAERSGVNRFAQWLDGVNAVAGQALHGGQRTPLFVLPKRQATTGCENQIG